MGRLRHRIRSVSLPLLGVVWLAALLNAQTPTQTPAARPESISFAKEIFPILEANCLSCHGAQMQLARLDLRTRESALVGGAHGPAVVPGNAEQSRLFRRITGAEAPAMPMSGDALAPSQIAAIKTWIEQGATWEATTAAATAVRQSPRGARADGHHARAAQLLGVQATRAGATASRRQQGSHQPDRSLPGEGARRSRPHAGASRRSADAGASRLSGSAWPAADAGAGGRIPGGPEPLRLGAADRQAPRLAALRRTLRAALARCRALRRLGGLRVRHASAQRVAVSRLRDQVDSTTTSRTTSSSSSRSPATSWTGRRNRP